MFFLNYGPSFKTSSILMSSMLCFVLSYLNYAASIKTSVVAIMTFLNLLWISSKFVADIVFMLNLMFDVSLLSFPVSDTFLIVIMYFITWSLMKILSFFMYHM